MPRHKKKLFSKKNSVTFQLVHRSQQDPEIANENAPQRVLVPKNQDQFGDKEKRLELQSKYGIPFQDDADYLEYLKDVKDNRVEWPELADQAVQKLKEKKMIQLPPEVLPSIKEEEVGMLSKAAPGGLQLDLDPDIVAALDEDFDFDDPNNQLEDDFIQLAGGAVTDEENSKEEVEFDENEEDAYVSSAFEDDTSSQGSEGSLPKGEAKSLYSKHSMSSSTVPRNEHLQFIDRKFEKFLEKFDKDDYDEDVGSMAAFDDEYLLQFMEEIGNTPLDTDPSIIDKTRELARKISTEKTKYVTVEVPQKIQWDAQSILSTKSNTENLPTTLKLPKMKKIKINKKTGLPVGELDDTKQTLEALNEAYEIRNGENSAPKSVISRISELSIRSKNETPEERKERKKKFKEYKRERVMEKKANKIAFKEESLQQQKVILNKSKTKAIHLT